MKKNLAGIFIIPVMLFFFIAAAALWQVPSVYGIKQNIPRVLYINSYHRGFKWSDGIEQGLRDKFKASGKDIDFYIEYLDTRRFPEQVHLPAIVDALAKKHRKINYDVIVVSDNNAFDFVIKYRSRIFHDTPVVFCGFNSFRQEYIKGIKDITGVNEEADFSRTIDMALGLHKDTDTLVFVTSDYYSSGKINQERVEKELIPEYEKKYKIIQFRNPYLDELEQRLSSLPEQSLVFVFGASLDNYDRQFLSSAEYYRRVAVSAKVPAYSFWDFTLDTGMTGGNIITGPEQGNKAAELVLMILEGIPAGEIPVVMQSPASKIFDFNALKRFKIPEGSLPQGSIVINRPDTFYHRYRPYVWITISAFIVLSSMVFILTYLLRKSRLLAAQLLAESGERQKAVIELQHNREQLEAIVGERTAELRRTYDMLKEREILFHNMFDMNSAVMYLLNPDTGRIIEVNRAALEFYGYPQEGMGTMDIYAINQLGKEDIDVNMKLAISGRQRIFEYRHRMANGDIRHVEIHSSPIDYKGEKILFSIVHDITDRKMAEEEREKLIIELKEALADVKTLSGLLPICASCKKIRNDGGYWEQIEQYISDHSEAQFSHSLCPDCVEKLYPGLKIKK